MLWLECHLTYFFLSSSGEKFDVIFIDADKENYIHYYKAVMDGKNSDTQIVCRKSLKKGTFGSKDSNFVFDATLKARRIC